MVMMGRRGVRMGDEGMTLTLLSWREGTKKVVAFSEGDLLISLIRKAGHPPDGVLVLGEEGPLPLDEELGKTFAGKDLQVIRVASGG